jgi:ribosome biogenesis SPOUT family RNA methylase Rps3
MIVVVEHLDPEVFKWCEIEYEHISKTLGKDNVLFSNTDNEVLSKLGRVEKKSVRELGLKDACVLDPDAKEVLTPDIAKKYKYFIFGGILGDYPPKKRTKEELTGKLPYPAYNLGKDQMSTDTAVIVTKQIYDGIPLTELKFVEEMEVEIEEGLSISLPFKYLILDNKVQISPKIIELLREQEGF